jgi:ABC-type multidrug transport system fused ATPase/permease subunit
MRFIFHILLKLWVHLSARRQNQLIILSLLTVVSSVAELISLGTVLPFLAIISNQSNDNDQINIYKILDYLGMTGFDQTLFITILFIAAAVFAGGIRLLLLWLQTDIGHSIGGDLGVSVFKKILHQPYIFHLDRNSSEVVATLMSKINTVVYFTILPTLTFISSIIVVVFIILFLILINSFVTSIVFFGFGIAYSIVIFTNRKRLLLNSSLVASCQNHQAKLIQESLGGIREILLYGMEGKFVKIYQEIDLKLRLSLRNLAILSSAPKPIFETYGIVLIGLLSYFLTSQKYGIPNAIPVLGLLALASQRLLPLIQQGYSSLTSIQGSIESLKHVIEYLDKPSPKIDVQILNRHLTFVNEIRLKNIEFRFNLNSAFFFRCDEVIIPHGSRVGIVGKTGSGKSTFIDILVGLLHPSKGGIFIDGVEINESNRKMWQSKISYVPQTIFLSDSSVMENIAYGLNENKIDTAMVRRAAQEAHIADVIETLPQNYQTFIGERGVRLSGGQRQRLGIARALYKNSEILIFDEATSALDENTEQAVFESIYRLNKKTTIFIISHRLSTLNNCNIILNLNDGILTKYINNPE